MTELMKFESQVAKKYPELKVHEQEAVLGVLKYLDEDAKRYLLLHQTTSGLDAMLKGLQFYDEQLRVLTFQKEHHHGYLNAFGAGKGDKGDGCAFLCGIGRESLLASRLWQLVPCGFPGDA